MKKIIFLCIVSSLFFSCKTYSAPLVEKTFNNFYTTGEFDFRVVPPELLNQKAPQFLILAGDSNVFGDGLTDHETLPVLLSKALPSFYIYNFGIRGGGPHDSLHLLQTKNYQHLIKQARGVFIYNFYPYLFERVIGAKNYLKWSKKESPYYDFNESGELVYRGTFSDRQWITSIYKFIIAHPWVDRWLPIFPQIHSWHIKLTAAIFSEMKKKVLADFPHSKFIVVLNNSYSQEPWHLWQNKELKNHLQKYQVDCVETPAIEKFREKFIFSDGHINADGVNLQARILAPILKL